MTRIHADRRSDADIDDSGVAGYPEADGHLPAFDDLRDGFSQLISDYENLQRRLETLPVIEQAKGILIGRYRIDADTAFALLRRWSSHTNIKLRDLSGILVTAACQPATSTGPQDPPAGPTLATVLDWLSAATGPWNPWRAGAANANPAPASGGGPAGVT